jgi:hypothetical protein
MAPALRLVVGARPLPHGHGPASWLSQLGWDQPQRPARVLSIGPLLEADVYKFVTALEPPLSPELHAPVSSSLTRQAAGSALLLRWLIQDLQAELASGRQPDLDALNARNARPPGLAAFVRSELMAHTAGAHSAETERRREEADAALAVLAEALGPMPEEDLWAVLQRVLDEAPPRKRLLDAVARFVACTPGGELALEHPMVGQLLKQELLARSSLLTRAGEALLDWQVDTARAFTKGSTSKCPPYVLAQYARHLGRAARTEKSQATVADWACLVSSRWVRAREASLGLAGVSEDADAVRQALHGAAAQGDRAALAAVFRAALVLATVHSRSANFSPALLVLARQFKLLASNHAEIIASAQASEDRIQSFALLASIETDAAVREELIEGSLRAACEIARGKDTWCSCSDAASVLEGLLEPSQILEFAEFFKKDDVRFVPHGLALLIARRVDPTELPRLAEVIGDRVQEHWRHEFHLTCASRLKGDLREAALEAALIAARVSKDVINEVDVLLVFAPEQARRRAQEWLAALGPFEAPFANDIVSDLGQLCERDLLSPEEIEPVLKQIAERQDHENFPWGEAELLKKHRTALPTLDRLVHSTLEVALTSPSRSYPRRVLIGFSGGLTAEERAKLIAVVATADAPDIRAIHLARILAGTPPEDALMRTELTEAAKAAIPLVDPPSLRMKSLFELAAVSDSALKRWCGERAFEAAAKSRDALAEFDSSNMLRFADVVEPSFVEAQLPNILRLAEGTDDAHSQWRLRFALASDDLRKQQSVAREAYAAARSALPDIATAAAILEDSIELMPPELRREAYAEGIRWMRADEATVHRNSVVAWDKVLRRVRFMARVIPSDQIQTSELWEALAILHGSDYNVLTEAAIAWKYASRILDNSKDSTLWFCEFQPAYLNVVQSFPFNVDVNTTCAYWVVCARLAPSLRARLTFIIGGWRHLTAERNPWDATDNIWPRRQRATALYAIAADSPPLLGGIVRRSARRVDPDSTLTDALGRKEITRFLMTGIDRKSKPWREKGFNKNVKRLALKQERSMSADSLIQLLDEVSDLPRKDALELLCDSNRALVDLIGADAARAALDDLMTPDV